ncbi:type II toxin-antitoxin system RelE/ParE family toxin [Methylolobus aquaticus]
MRVEWSPEALNDLDRAVEYIAQDKPGAAHDVARRIWEASRQLADHPGIGRPGRVPGTRELVITGLPYLAPYVIREDRIVILRILHGAMKWPPS